MSESTNEMIESNPEHQADLILLINQKSNHNLRVLQPVSMLSSTWLKHSPALAGGCLVDLSVNFPDRITKYQEISLANRFIFSYTWKIHQQTNNHSELSDSDVRKGAKQRLKAIEVKVFDNDLEKAMRILKKKIQN